MANAPSNPHYSDPNYIRAARAKAQADSRAANGMYGAGAKKRSSRTSSSKRK